MWKTALATVLLVVLSVAIGAGGTYAYLNKKHVDEKNDLNAQIVTLNNKINGLENNSISASSTSTADETALRKLYQADAPGVNFAITTISGNFANGSYGSDGGGYNWYAVKQNGTWIEAIQTQDPEAITCADADKYAFPVTTIPTCLSADMKTTTR